MRILFIGTGDIGVPTFRFLATRPEHRLVGLVTGEDKKIGREQIMTPPAIKVAALEFDVPVFQPASIKSADALDQIDELVPDLIVVMAYGQILPNGVLRAPRKACLNLHASILPKHRGASPIQAAIRSGDSEAGVTVMYVAKKLDAGDILCSESLPLGPTMTGGQLHDQLAQLAPRALAKALEFFAEREDVPRIPQDHEAATYLGKLTRKDGEIDWSLPALEIERMVRAFEPWPGCYTELPGGKKLKVYPLASVHEGVDATQAEPGTVLATNEEDGNVILVASGAGSVVGLREVQIEGKKRLPVKDFLSGYQLKEGTVLGRVPATVSDPDLAGSEAQAAEAAAEETTPSPPVDPPLPRDSPE